jgi:HEAT repeat protein
MQSDTRLTTLLADLTSGDEARAEAAACALAETPEAALAALGPLLHSEDVDRRWWSVRTLGQMQAPPPDWLIQALADKSAEVRAAAALALSTHPVEDAAPALVQALQDEDSIVAILAVNAVVAIGKPAVPALLNAYPSSSPRGRIQTMRALAEIQDHRAIPLMLKATEQDSAMLYHWAEQGLERLGLNMVYIKPE